MVSVELVGAVLTLPLSTAVATLPALVLKNIVAVWLAVAATGVKVPMKLHPEAGAYEFPRPQPEPEEGTAVNAVLPAIVSMGNPRKLSAELPTLVSEMLAWFDVPKSV
jgi:hypothetical protein